MTRRCITPAELLRLAAERAGLRSGLRTAAHDPVRPELSLSRAPTRDRRAPNPVLSPVEGQRTFTLNSDEAYEALCELEAQPWIKAGSLPREPRVWGPRVVREDSYFTSPRT